MTSKSAKERYRLLAIKLGWNAKSGGEGECPGPKTPRKTAGVTKNTGRVGNSGKKGRGKKIDVQNDDENDGDVVKGESGMDSAGET